MSDLTPPISSTTDFYRPVEVFLPRPPKRRYWLHGLLLLATIFTTLVVGSRMQYNFEHNQPAFKAEDEFIPLFPVGWALAHPARLLGGVPFSLTLVFILFTHEMGHYLYCRRYGVQATLPFFIPMPTPIGTMGAVIRIRAPIRSRAALFDIGIAGPIAGFVVATAALAVGLSLSKPIAADTGAADLQLGYPLIFQIVHRLLASPGGTPVPLSHMLLHPIAIAAWVGMFATALNLLPSGQLDGGHIVYALWPRAHRVVSWLTVFGLVYLRKYYYGWGVWAALVAAINIIAWRQKQAPDFPEIRGVRWLLGLLALIMFILTITVVPFQGLDWR